MRKAETQADPAAVRGEGRQDGGNQYYARLATELHALAQPLTILRSSVVGAGLEGIAPEKRRRYLEISQAQAERACKIFESLQEIVIAAQADAERETPADPVG
jgi:hypothetical protein